MSASNIRSSGGVVEENYQDPSGRGKCFKGDLKSLVKFLLRREDNNQFSCRLRPNSRANVLSLNPAQISASARRDYLTVISHHLHSLRQKGQRDNQLEATAVRFAYEDLPNRSLHSMNTEQFNNLLIDTSREMLVSSFLKSENKPNLEQEKKRGREEQNLTIQTTPAKFRENYQTFALYMSKNLQARLEQGSKQAMSQATQNKTEKETETVSFVNDTYEPLDLDFDLPKIDDLFRDGNKGDGTQRKSKRLKTARPN